MNIIFDYNRTLFNPDSNALYDGVVELLRNLSVQNRLFLVSKNEPGRRQHISELGIASYFARIAFVEQKSCQLFTDLVGDSTDVVVVGDRVKDEIGIGGALGFVTIWVQQGKFADEVPSSAAEQPTFITTSVTGVQNIISEL
jgi:FMN phosphatase YigB (HAD superfamily)